MALNSFASLVRERQERDATLSTPAPAPTSTSTSTQAQQNTTQPNAVRHAAQSRPSGLIPQTKEQKHARETSPNTAPQAATTAQPAAGVPKGSGKVLSLDDTKMLCALSAMQIRYGKPAEAIPYLMLVKKDNPTNIKALRLLVLALMRLERWQEAEVMLAELEKHEAANQGTLSDGLGYLYRSLVAFKLHSLSDAKSWFNRFRKYVIGSIRGNAQ